MEQLEMVLALIGSAAAVVGLFIKTFTSMGDIRRGVQCMLRQQMLEVYYKCRENRTIRQYQYENFVMSYRAYKALGGNSFIEHIKNEVDEFEVVT